MQPIINRIFSTLSSVEMKLAFSMDTIVFKKRQLVTREVKIHAINFTAFQIISVLNLIGRFDKNGNVF